MVDLPWGSELAGAFVKNVGLVTSKGHLGDNIMACEWTYQLSYSPGLVGVSIGPNKATAHNIRENKEFGISLASINQTVASSLAGGSSGKEFNKIEALKELGFEFEKSNHIQPLLVKNAALQLECKLVSEITIGDHILFVGEVLRAQKTSHEPLAYHHWKYWKLNETLPKPSDEERKKQQEVIQKHSKN